jgi:hypothetical protein
VLHVLLLNEEFSVLKEKTMLLGIAAIMRPFGLSLMSLIGTYLSIADLGTFGGNVMA